MKFSVIIPTYNVESKLDRCLESILSQNYTDYEIILVDDGSGDKTADICRSYSEKYINIKFFSKNNGGAASARNCGLDNAEGDYILFVDSDDFVDATYFESMSNDCLEDGLAVFTFSFFNNNVTRKRSVAEDLLDETSSLFNLSKELILSRLINSPCAKIFSRSLIEKHHLRFDEKMPVAEDFNFCLAYLFLCKKVSVKDKSIYFYDVSSNNSLVRSRKKGLIDIYPYVFDTAYNSIISSAFSDSEKKELLCIWDKLHTDSFITCVMEEQKDTDLSTKDVLSNIRYMCKKFYSEYKPDYGYQNFVHYLVRVCIKYKLALLLYVMCKIYNKIRT
ncbi:MAG: glycosyltransferase family 2 protein [Eubacterium sp.]